MTLDVAATTIELGEDREASISRGFRASKRDVGVELARIIACLIVIGCHTVLPFNVDGSPRFYRLLVSCIFGDGVAIFFLIYGCFAFRSKISYTRLLTRMVRTILAPLALVSLFGFFVIQPIADGKSLSTAFDPEGLKNAIKVLMTWDNPVGTFIHLWYLYVYALLVVVQPLNKAIAKYLDEGTGRWGTFLGMTLAVLILNDVTSNRLLVFSHHTIAGLIPASLFALWGHYLYSRRDRFYKVPPVGYLLLFVALNLVRAWLLKRGLVVDGSHTHLLFWYSAFGLLCAICMMGFSLTVVSQTEGRGPSAIRALASLTFGVYLLHIAVVRVFDLLGFRQALQALFLIPEAGFFGYCAYMLALIFCVAIAASVGVLVYRGLKGLVGRVSVSAG